MMVFTGCGFTTFQSSSAAGLLGNTLLGASNLAAFSRSFFGCTARGEDDRQQI